MQTLAWGETPPAYGGRQCHRLLDCVVTRQDGFANANDRGAAFLSWGPQWSLGWSAVLPPSRHGDVGGPLSLDGSQTRGRRDTLIDSEAIRSKIRDVSVELL